MNPRSSPVYYQEVLLATGICGPSSNSQTVDISTVYNQTLADRLEFLQGTLDMLILRTLALAPLHGYAIAQAIRHATDGAIQVEAGSLYPALQRLELQGLLAAKWELSDRNRRLRTYRLTAAGRKRLHAEVSRWEKFVRAISQALNPRPAEE
jgi:PadR family transcriptional regulator, regulatory protein PadR